MKELIKKIADLCDMETSNFLFAFIVSIIIVSLLVIFGTNY